MAITQYRKELGIAICKRWPIDLADVDALISFILASSEKTTSVRNDIPGAKIHVTELPGGGIVSTASPSAIEQGLPAALEQFVVDMSREYGPEAGEGARVSAKAAMVSLSSSIEQIEDDPFCWLNEKSAKISFDENLPGPDWIPLYRAPRSATKDSKPLPPDYYADPRADE